MSFSRRRRKNVHLNLSLNRQRQIHDVAPSKNGNESDVYSPKINGVFCVRRFLPVGDSSAFVW